MDIEAEEWSLMKRFLEADGRSPDQEFVYLDSNEASFVKHPGLQSDCFVLRRRYLDGLAERDWIDIERDDGRNFVFFLTRKGRREAKLMKSREEDG